MPEPYVLDQWVWTDADFERMGWHDAAVHALAYISERSELAFDIDYIVKWVHPEPGETHFSFWIAPATLVFENVSDVRIDLEPLGEVSVQKLIREDPQPMRPAFEGPAADWLWTLDCNEGAVQLRATGFRQVFRSPPVHFGSQRLGIAARGGISFSEVTGAARHSRSAESDGMPD